MAFHVSKKYSQRHHVRELRRSADYQRVFGADRMTSAFVRTFRRRWGIHIFRRLPRAEIFLLYNTRTYFSNIWHRLLMCWALRLLRFSHFSLVVLLHLENASDDGDASEPLLEIQQRRSSNSTPEVGCPCFLKGEHSECM